MTAHTRPAPARGSDATVEQTSTGLSPRAAAMLAYSGWWVTGAVMLALEPRQRFVRFHAHLALRALGSLWLAGLILWTLSVVVAFVSPGLAEAAALCAQLVWGLGIVGWGLGLWRAWHLRWEAMPGVGGRPSRS